MIRKIYKSRKKTFVHKEAKRLLKALDLYKYFKEFHKQRVRLESHFTSNKNIKIFGHFIKTKGVQPNPLAATAPVSKKGHLMTFEKGTTSHNLYRVTSDHVNFSETESLNTLSKWVRTRQKSIASSIREPLTITPRRNYRNQNSRYNFKPRGKRFQNRTRSQDLPVRSLEEAFKRMVGLRKRVTVRSLRGRAVLKVRGYSLEICTGLAEHGAKRRSKGLEAPKNLGGVAEAKMAFKNTKNGGRYESGVFSILNCERFFEEDRCSQNVSYKSHRHRPTNF